jgi:ADP-heptose:LPS heptosyltransferase
MNLALFKVNNLGDNIVFLPVVQALRKRFPDWRLMVFTSPAAAEL